jgi:threonine dehydrogenase-like Zn-dependent dehydrogenase
MKAVCWMGKEKMSVETVPDPKILNPRDAIVRITSTCICGSDLHLYDGLMPTMEQGDIMGHEFMGEVVEVGGAIKPEVLKPGDRVVPDVSAIAQAQNTKQERCTSWLKLHAFLMRTLRAAAQHSPATHCVGERWWVAACLH